MRTKGLILAGNIVSFNYKSVKINTPHGEATRPSTVCTIQNDKGEELSKSGVTLHVDDNDNRLVARRYAFDKAVAQIKDKGVRKAMWEEFRSKVKQPK